MTTFEVVDDEVTKQSQQQSAVAQKMLLIALGQLSKRAVAGISTAFSLLGLGSVWALWYVNLSTVNIQQLIGIGMYSVFLLALEIIRRKRT